MKPVNVKDGTYIDHNVKSNDKDPKFEVSGRVRISKYKNIFPNDYNPNWSQEVFVIKKINAPRTYVISDLNGEKTIPKFYEKELQKTNQTEFKVKKVTKRKSDKLYARWKGCDNLF